MTHFFNESFVLALCFIAFAYLAYKPIKNALLNALDRKISEIKTKLIETDKLKNDAQKLLKETQKEMDEFDQKKAEMIKNAKDSIENTVILKQKEMGLLIERMETSANQNIKHDVKPNYCKTAE